MSLFSSLSVGWSGLSTSQNAINATAHNLQMLKLMAIPGRIQSLTFFYITLLEVQLHH